MSADAISTCPNCMEVELREEHDLYCLDADDEVVFDDSGIRPVTYVAHIELRCRSCGWSADLRMTAPLVIS